MALGNHTGGYDGFSFEVTLKPTGNELLVHVFDPSDSGAQPNGKQRISAIDNPGGDTYTPSSGIWQTVWLEAVPATYISSLKIDQASTSAITVTVDVASARETHCACSGEASQIALQVVDKTGATVASGAATCCQPATLPIASPSLWSPASPYLYDLKVCLTHVTAI